MATARCSSPANYPEINGTTSSASRRSPTPSSIASCTTPIGWNWTGRPCVKSMPPSRLKLMLDHPRRKPPAPYLRQPSQQKGIRNDRRAQLPARPGGSTGTSRARRCASRESAPRRARVPPIDYRDGLSPCLTSHQETDITTTIQRRRQRPRHTGRNRSEQVVAIVGMPTDRHSSGFSYPFCWTNRSLPLLSYSDGSVVIHTVDAQVTAARGDLDRIIDDPAPALRDRWWHSNCSRKSPIARSIASS